MNTASTIISSKHFIPVMITVVYYVCELLYKGNC